MLSIVTTEPLPDRHLLTLAQFRARLADHAERSRNGVHITDAEALRILASDRATLVAHNAWVQGQAVPVPPPPYTPRVPTPRAPVTNRPPVRPVPPVGYTSEASQARSSPAASVWPLPKPVDETRSAWPPVRFNAPPGWPQPPKDWTAKWMGMNIPASEGPRGAAPAPSSWRYWDPVEPGWTQWRQATRSHHRKWMWINSGIAAVGLVLSLAGFAAAPAGGAFLVFWGAVLFGTIAAVRSASRVAAVDRDPTAVLRQQLQRAG